MVRPAPDPRVSVRAGAAGSAQDRERLWPLPSLSWSRCTAALARLNPALLWLGCTYLLAFIMAPVAMEVALVRLDGLGSFWSDELNLFHDSLVCLLAAAPGLLCVGIAGLVGRDRHDGCSK